jgi:hypothetical protein
METIDNDFYEVKPVGVPVFLKVLCILTFVGCGVYFLSAIYGVITFETTKQSFKMMSQMSSTLPSNPFSDMLGGTFEHLENFFFWSQITQYASIVNCGLCLAGAIMMYKLKRNGFYIYTIGQILPIASGIMLYIAAKDIPFIGFTTIASVVMNIIFIAAFVIMYSVNLKHLK